MKTKKVYTNKELKAMSEDERALLMLKLLDSISRGLSRLSERLSKLELWD